VRTRIWSRKTNPSSIRFGSSVDQVWIIAIGIETCHEGGQAFGEAGFDRMQGLEELRGLIVLTGWIVEELFLGPDRDSVFHNIQYNQPFTVKFTLTNFRIFTDTRSGEVRYHSQADFVVADTIKFTLNFLETALCRKTAAGWKISLIHVTFEKPRAVYMPPFYQKYDTVRYIPEHYRERMGAFRGEAVHRGGIVMLGNSIYPEVAGKNEAAREVDRRLREVAGSTGIPISIWRPG
jgi:hypothetical protein